MREPGASGEGEMGGFVAGDLDLGVDMVAIWGWKGRGLECLGMGLRGLSVDLLD